MRLMVLCPHFEPDTAPTGEVMSAIASELVALGHELSIVTALPWYRHHAIEPGWQGRLVRRESTAWGAIVRVHPFPTDKRNIPARAAAFAGFTALTGLVGLLERERVDGVLSMSPPLTLGPAGWAIARTRRVPFVFNVQDIFPDVAMELGAITDPRVIRIAQWMERTTYRRADAVTVLSEDLRANVAAKIGPGAEDKVHVIPNFVDTVRIRPDIDATAYRREHGLEGRTVVMYAGNVGHSQSLDLLVGAARRYAARDDVAFVVNGGGVARADLAVQGRDLPNLRFVDYQPRERLPEVLAAGDIHVVPLRRGLARSSVPSKLYSILAAGRPVVASVDPGTEVAVTVEKAGAGLAVPPGDLDSFVGALDRLIGEPAAARRAGRSGRAFVESWATPRAVACTYAELFGQLAAR